METDKRYKVTRISNGVNEYLTMDLNPSTMKATFYYVPRSCSYSFDLSRAMALANEYKGRVIFDDNGSDKENG